METRSKMIDAIAAAFCWCWCGANTVRAVDAGRDQRGWKLQPRDLRHLFQATLTSGPLI